MAGRYARQGITMSVGHRFYSCRVIVLAGLGLVGLITRGCGGLGGLGARWALGGLSSVSSGFGARFGLFCVRNEKSLKSSVLGLP